MLRRIHSADRGASVFEYAAVVLLISAIMSSLLGSGILVSISSGLTSAVATLSGAAPPAAAKSGESGESGSDESDPGPADESGSEADSSEEAGSGARSTSGDGEGGRTIKWKPETPTTDNGWAGEFGDSMWIQLQESGRDLGEEAADAAKSPWKYVRDSGKSAVDNTVKTLDHWRKDGEKNARETALKSFEVSRDHGRLIGAGYQGLSTQYDMWWKNDGSAGGAARRGWNSIFDEEFDKARERGGSGAEPAAIAVYNGLGYINPLEAKSKYLQLLGVPKPKTPPRGPKHLADGKRNTGAKGGNGNSKNQGKSQGGGKDEGKDGAGKPTGASCPTKNSFLPATPVLMADGSTVPIKDVDVGDEVLAFDSRTGEEGPRPVTHLIQGQGQKTLVTITVTNENGETGSLTATDKHPFWTPEAAQWVNAIDLKPGTWLRTNTGTWTRITAVKTRQTPSQRVHNLTIADLHTYHVLAGATPVLAHNSNCLFGSPLKKGIFGQSKVETERRISDVVDFYDMHGRPPSMTHQGGRKGRPAGEYGNSNGRLPEKSEGYYTESDIWPSAKGTGNRGKERLVFGEKGEVYYTSSHYKSFIRIR